MLVAATLAADMAGPAGIAVSGAGADATNVILNKPNAYVLDSTIVSARDVLIGASDNSTISATVATASLAIGAGGAGGVGASIGASLALKIVGSAMNGDVVAGRVHANDRGSGIPAAHDLALSAPAHDTLVAP